MQTSIISRSTIIGKALLSRKIPIDFEIKVCNHTPHFYGWIAKTLAFSSLISMMFLVNAFLDAGDFMHLNHLNNPQVRQSLKRVELK